MDERRWLRTAAGVFLLGAFTLSYAACGDGDVDGDGDGDGHCDIGDPFDGGDCECSGDECVCPGSGDCAILCIADCGLQCAGSGSCDFDCGDGCDVACTGSGNCDIEVGAQSTVECTGSGDCDITCEGDCTVRCPGSGTCTVRCAPGFECNIDACNGDAETCANGDLVCNGSC